MVTCYSSPRKHTPFLRRPSSRREAWPSFLRGSAGLHTLTLLEATNLGEACAVPYLQLGLDARRLTHPPTPPLPASKNDVLPIKGSNSVSELADSRGRLPCGLGDFFTLRHC